MVLFRRLQRPLAALLLAGWACVLWPPPVEAQPVAGSAEEAPPAAFGNDLPPQALYAPAAPKAAPSPQRDLAAARLAATLQPTASLALSSDLFGRACLGYPASPASASAPARAP